MLLHSSHSIKGISVESRPPIIGVIGAGKADDRVLRMAEDVGRAIARRRALLVCGGLGGVMEAAAKGAFSEGGVTIGILPHADPDNANPYIVVPIATGFGEGRNIIIVRTADALIAVGGEYGTLSEIAFTLKAGKPIVGLATWDVRGLVAAKDPEDAVARAFGALKKGP
jgi:hypothetical protein